LSIEGLEPEQTQKGCEQSASTSLNVDVGLMAMDGSRELYNDVLLMFAEKYQHILSVDLLFEDSEAQDLRRFFHTIKGLAATIGCSSSRESRLIIFVVSIPSKTGICISIKTISK